MEFRPIASSSAGCAYLLSGKAGSLLVDCGAPIKAIQQATGFKVSSLSGCLVSHAHGDHCKSVAPLAKLGVDIYASKETWRALNAVGHRFNVMGEKVPQYIDGWKVMGFPVVHDCPGTFGFLIDDGEDRLLYLTDTAYSPYRFDGVTIMAVEANFDGDEIRDNKRSGVIDKARYRRTLTTHMSIDRLVDMLKANDLTKVREIHLLHLSDTNSNELEFKDKVQRATGVPVFVAAK